MPSDAKKGSPWRRCSPAAFGKGSASATEPKFQLTGYRSLAVAARNDRFRAKRLISSRDRKGALCAGQ
jgi:hypothetical protein